MKYVKKANKRTKSSTELPWMDTLKSNAAQIDQDCSGNQIADLNF